MARPSFSKVPAGPEARPGATPPARSALGARLQAKLPVSQPGDRLEQEADRVADQVMRMPAPASAGADAHRAPIRTPVLQRLCSACEEELHRQPLGRGGKPLDAAARAFFEPRFGVDLGAVRIHTGTSAAQLAQDLGALAYTVGRDVVFNAGQYAPHSDTGRRLLAHELTHVLQQRGPGRAATPQVQRQVDPDHPGPCDQAHIDDLIEPAFLEARRWRRLAAAWLEAHLDHIRARAALGRDGFVRIGQRVYDELMLLERHFRISTVLRVSLPQSPSDSVSIEDLQRLANASYWVRRRFGDVELTLSYLCQANCPRGRVGSETLGSAAAGSRELTLYTRCFDAQSATTRAGVVLHEAFHASFSEFDHDTYSFEGHYPGSHALTNAESFATFAAIVATGHDYRIIVLPEITIHGGGE